MAKIKTITWLVHANEGLLFRDGPKGLNEIPMPLK